MKVNDKITKENKLTAKLEENDKIKVHIFDSRNREIHTRAKDVIFTVYKKSGNLGINWTTDRAVALFGADDETFAPFNTFASSVIFEKVDSGQMFHYDTVSNVICLTDKELEV